MGQQENSNSITHSSHNTNHTIISNINSDIEENIEVEICDETNLIEPNMEKLDISTSTTTKNTQPIAILPTTGIIVGQRSINVRKDRTKAIDGNGEFDEKIYKPSNDLINN